MTGEQASEGTTEWVVHGERTLYSSRWLSLNLVDVSPPAGARFEHHVVRMQRVVVVAILDADNGSILMIRRHRFIDGSWGWEVPMGIVEPGEPSDRAAHREVEEETGWRPGGLVHSLTFQPAIGIADSPHELYVGAAAEHVGEPADRTEAAEVTWVPLTEVPAMVSSGSIRDGASLVAVLHALTLRTSS